MREHADDLMVLGADLLVDDHLRKQRQRALATKFASAVRLDTKIYMFISQGLGLSPPDCLRLAGFRPTVTPGKRSARQTATMC